MGCISYKSSYVQYRIKLVRITKIFVQRILDIIKNTIYKNEWRSVENGSYRNKEC